MSFLANLRSPPSYFVPPTIPLDTHTHARANVCLCAAYDFDVIVGGHLTRMGTKEDVQRQRDFFGDVLEGSMSRVCMADKT